MEEKILDETFDIGDWEEEDFTKTKQVCGFFSDVIKPLEDLLLPDFYDTLYKFVLSNCRSPKVFVVSAQEFVSYLNIIDCKNDFIKDVSEALLNINPNFEPEEFINSLTDSELHGQFIKNNFKGEILGFYNNLKSKFRLFVLLILAKGKASDEEVKRFIDCFGEKEYKKTLMGANFNLGEDNTLGDKDDDDPDEEEKSLKEQIKDFNNSLPETDMKVYNDIMQSILSNPTLLMAFDSLEDSTKPNRNKKILKILADDRYVDITNLAKEHYDFTKKDLYKVYQELSKKAWDKIDTTIDKSDQPEQYQIWELCRDSQIYYDIVLPVYDLLDELDSKTLIHRMKDRPISVGKVLEEIDNLESEIVEKDFEWYKYLDGRIDGILPLDNDKEIHALASFEKIKALMPDVLKELSRLSKEDQAMEISDIIQRFGQYSNALTSSLITPVEDEPSIEGLDDVDEGKNEESGQESNQNLTPRLPKPHDFNSSKMKNLNMELFDKGLLENIKDDVFLYWFSFKDLEAEPPKMYWPGSVHHLRALLNILYDRQTKIGYVCKIAGSIFVKKNGKGYTSLSKTNTDEVKDEIEYLVGKAKDG